MNVLEAVRRACPESPLVHMNEQGVRRWAEPPAARAAGDPVGLRRHGIRVKVGGGITSASSLAQLSTWCAERFGPRDVRRDGGDRPFDPPWMMLDAGLAERARGWRPRTPRDAISESIADHVVAHPGWLDATES